MSTLTFVYADATAVLGPLSRSSEPHAYDLCEVHAQRMSPPRGWELLRVPGAPEARDDLVAISDVVHPPRPAASGSAVASGPAAAAPTPDEPPRRLHMVRGSDD